ncbi:uncharacterized protein [Primulina eburnea]|uniref:uncharacterized protein isoform X5 n=1 Tax=Primulina eburnea TaxID=1245227 RepID=UPI003C6BF1A2
MILFLSVVGCFQNTEVIEYLWISEGFRSIIFMGTKINSCLMLIVLVAPVVLYPVVAESKVIDVTSDTKAKGNGNGSVNPAVKPVKDGKDVHVNGNDLIKQPELTEGVNGGEQKNTNGTVSKDDQKQNEGSDSKSDKGTEKVKNPVCDSSSNRCTDDDKTLVACLRIPGNESPERSLLILNKGKGPLSVTLSAPDLVHLEKKKIHLQKNEVTEQPLLSTSRLKKFSCKFIGKLIYFIVPTHTKSVIVPTHTNNSRHLFLMPNVEHACR